jgi:hypothetical protein
MPMSSDEEIRARAVELSIQSGTKQVLQRARSIYDFIKGDKKRQQPAAEPIPLTVTPEVMQRRIHGQVDPT